MRRPTALCALALTLAAPLLPQSKAPAASSDNDPLLRAMLAEVRRTRQLVAYGEAPYFIELAVDDADNLTVVASMGAVYAPLRARFRQQRPGIRVGAPSLDNTGYLGSDAFSGTRFDSDFVPVDNDVYSIRSAFWLALDRTYKTAVEAIGKKQAALSSYASQVRLADFSTTAPKFERLRDVRHGVVDEVLWQERVRLLTAPFREREGVLSAEAEYNWGGGNFYYCNSEGTTLRLPDRMAMLRLRASASLPKGGEVYHGVQFAALDSSSLPDEKTLRKIAITTADELAALVKAPVAEAYTGPVLFESEAAAQLFAEVFGQELALLRKPVAEQGRNVAMPQSGLENKTGVRVLPTWMTLRDDANRKEWNGHALAGYFEADLEGVAPVAVTLVEKGILRNYLTTRQPVTGGAGSNGHARLPGPFGAKMARPGVLITEASETVPDRQLKQRLIEMAKQQNKPYGLMVRRMDFPSLASVAAVREMVRQLRASGGARLFSAPLLLFRVYQDGREELVRGLRFRNFGVRPFRDIVAAGDTPAVFEYSENGAPMALTGAVNFLVGCSSIAPAVLFEELELEPATDENGRAPLVAPPPAK